MVCPKCGSVIADGSAFCPSCGSDINKSPVNNDHAHHHHAQMTRCRKCGAEMSADEYFCRHCGTLVEKSGSPQPSPAPHQPMKESVSIPQHIPQEPRPNAKDQGVPQAEPQPEYLPARVSAPASSGGIAFCGNCGAKMDASVQFCPNCGAQRGSGSGGQPPYVQPPQPQYGGYNSRSGPFGGFTAGEAVSAAPAVVVLILDIFALVSFWFNMYYLNAFGRNGFNLAGIYESVGNILKTAGEFGFDIRHIDFSKLSGSGWLVLIIATVIFVLYLAAFVDMIVAFVRVASTRGPDVIKFWKTAGAVSSNVMAANIIAGLSCLMVNAWFSSAFRSTTLADVMGVMPMYYVILAVTLAAQIVAGIQIKSLQRNYFTGNRF